MKTTYDNMPALVVREGSLTRIFHGFQPITVTNQDETTIKHEGHSVDIEGPADYGSITSAIIRAEYPDEKKDAILLNRELVRDNPTHEKAAKYTAEYEALQDFRAYAKVVAAQVVEQLNSL